MSPFYVCRVNSGKPAGQTLFEQGISKKQARTAYTANFKAFLYVLPCESSHWQCRLSLLPIINTRPVSMRAGENKASTMRDSLIRRPFIKSSTVTSFWCLAAMQPEGSTRARILPGFPSLHRGSREAEVVFEPDPCLCATLFMKHWLCVRHTHNRTRCRISLLLKINTGPVFMRTDEYEAPTAQTNLT
ncbi:hypothetical protein CSKR_113086 [Clonorchis sinensis]|uniref:Uncharacterized protein n=1 Tax=Clonorchis sinensis TaxID=79923 RepID=A0A3R7H2P8_CLOSI|nr:hypothetical protein CSKR_113086 [Clonorchis sinensis]